MATKITNQATAEKAALKLNEGIEVQASSEPSAPREKTTSERLFPAFTTDDGAITNRPVRNLSDSPSQVPAAETLDIKSQDQTPTTQTPTAPIYVSESDLKGKMVKLKVDGIEQDVPAESLVKISQLERHSNAQLMKLAQERAELERERASFLAQKNKPQESQKQDPPVKKSSEIESLEKQIRDMQGFLAQQQEMLRPAIQEAGIQRLEKMAKDGIGANDVRNYFDKVREVAVSKAQEAQMKGDPNWAKFDSDNFYYETYKEMKLKDLLSQAPVSAPAKTAPQKSAEAPRLVNNNGEPINIPAFESSSGVPSRQSPDSNWQGTYSSLFKRAQESGAESDWMAVYRHKLENRE